ncbi:MAG: hypothetical protein GF311_25140 [Candidatus Lokiarchaeota archaeon]|nr:hypothetical protein [Candidatus Lokiarchaeota archaeon]
MELLKYSNPTYHMEISYPVKWEFIENHMGFVGAIISPLKDYTDTFRENVMIQVEDLSGIEITLQEYSDLTVENMKHLISKFKLLKPMDFTTLAGHPGRRIIAKGIQGKLRLQWTCAWTLTNNLAYVLTFTAKREQHDEYIPYFNEMIQSFRIL